MDCLLSVEKMSMKKVTSTNNPSTRAPLEFVVDVNTYLNNKLVPV